MLDDQKEQLIYQYIIALEKQNLILKDLLVASNVLPLPPNRGEKAEGEGDEPCPLTISSEAR